FYDAGSNPQGPNGAFAPGVDVDLLLTRNSATNVVVGYINGVEQFRFTDTAQLATFNAANNIIHFFIDDLVIPDEVSAGVADWIKIYSGPITPGLLLGAGTTVDRGISELQSLSIGGTVGTYTLSFNGQTTAPISSTATATQVQNALEALSTISGVGGTVGV